MEEGKGSKVGSRETCPIKEERRRKGGRGLGTHEACGTTFGGLGCGRLGHINGVPFSFQLLLFLFSFSCSNTSFLPTLFKNNLFISQISTVPTK